MDGLFSLSLFWRFTDLGTESRPDRQPPTTFFSSSKSLIGILDCIVYLIQTCTNDSSYSHLPKEVFWDNFLTLWFIQSCPKKLTYGNSNLILDNAHEWFWQGVLFNSNPVEHWRIKKQGNGQIAISHHATSLLCPLYYRVSKQVLDRVLSNITKLNKVRWSYIYAIEVIFTVVAF